MKSTTNTPLQIALAAVIVLFLLFGGGAMTGGMMDGGAMNGSAMNGSGWMSNRSWMWTPTILALALGVVFGWALFKKNR